MSKKQKYYLPTYEQAVSMCEANGNLLFYETKHKLDGYDISIFNYRLAQWSDFEDPLKDGGSVKAYEMRGLVFVFDKDGSLYDRFLLMDKFFNLDQTPSSELSVVKDLKVNRVFNKEDGSIASFIKLPNGRVFGKSKTSFSSDQAIEIQKIYDTDMNIKRCVDHFLDNNIVPIFEYVSPRNRIVVSYQETELILLQLRDNLTGEYLDIDRFSHVLHGVRVAESEDITLEKAIQLASYIKDKEGWVFQFSDGTMIKLKTLWYFNLHKLFTDEINRENTLLAMILNDTIDDVISQLGNDETAKLTKNEISFTIDVVNFKIGQLSDEIGVFLSEYTGDKKEFAIRYRKHHLFHFAMGIIGGKNKIDMIREYLFKKTARLHTARKWLDSAKVDYIKCH